MKAAKQFPNHEAPPQEYPPQMSTEVAQKFPPFISTLALAPYIAAPPRNPKTAGNTAMLLPASYVIACAICP